MELASLGITLVSGMALGIDTACHKGALKAGGRTIAVMGSGHGHIYPKENKALYEEISKNGAVISEFSHDTMPERYTFPKRNRIISGLSKGVVVVEAPEKSGALITANFALEQGREIFAVPGNVSSGLSRGTNRLIKDGAKLVESARDIINELRYVLDIEEENPLEDPRTGQNKIPLNVTGEEKIVFMTLDKNPKSADDISRATEMNVVKVFETLLKLELKKMVKMLPGENFVRL